MSMCRSRLLALPVLIVVVTLTTAQAAEEHPIVTLIKSKVKDPNKPFALHRSNEKGGGLPRLRTKPRSGQPDRLRHV